jgi:hypothetical protein
MPSMSDGEDVSLARLWSERRGGGALRAIFGAFRLDHIVAPFLIDPNKQGAAAMHQTGKLARSPRENGVSVITPFGVVNR